MNPFTCAILLQRKRYVIVVFNKQICSPTILQSLVVNISIPSDPRIPDAVKLFLEAKADVHKISNCGSGLLHASVVGNKTEITNLFIEAGRLLVILLVKPALAATWHDRPPVLGGHIPANESVSSINQFLWMATCERHFVASKSSNFHPDGGHFHFSSW